MAIHNAKGFYSVCYLSRGGCARAARPRAFPPLRLDRCCGYKGDFSLYLLVQPRSSLARKPPIDQVCELCNEIASFARSPILHRVNHKLRPGYQDMNCKEPAE
jgi:hypothetical protein